MNILVGICGSIGVLGIHAYLIRLAAEPGVRVRAMMTPTAARIVNRAALGAVVGSPVLSDLWQKDKAITPSLMLGDTDVLLLAPASANTIGLCAMGMASNIVSACYLAHRGSTVVAPSMAPQILCHRAVRRNIQTLMDDGVLVLPTGDGFVASTGQWSSGALCDYGQLLAAVLGAAAAHTQD